MTNLDSILKSRDITLPTKHHLVKAMVFPVGMYGCEISSIMKAECQRIDAFELWCWRRLLRVPWTARRFNQSILKESSPDFHWKDWCWSWNFNTLATWYEELTNWKDPDAGKNWLWEEQETTEDEIVGWHHLLDGHEFEQALEVGDGQECLACCSPWSCKESDMTEWLSWTEPYTQLSKLKKAPVLQGTMSTYIYIKPSNQNISWKWKAVRFVKYPDMSECVEISSV